MTFVETMSDDPPSYVTMSILMTVLGVLQTAWMSFLNGSALEGLTQPLTSALPNTETELSLEMNNVTMATQMILTDAPIRELSILGLTVRALLQTASPFVEMA